MEWTEDKTTRQMISLLHLKAKQKWVSYNSSFLVDFSVFLLQFLWTERVTKHNYFFFISISLKTNS